MITLILGTQWGDEGKGKIVDLLTDKANAVVRFQGGNNAGHTLVINNKKTISHLIPSGIMHKSTICVIGNGVVLNLDSLLKEIETLKKNNIPIKKRLKISNSCHLIMPHHIALDKAREITRGKKAIGTTGRGIGPAYEDKIARRGFRLQDILNKEIFAEKLKQVTDYHNHVLTTYLKAEPINFEMVLKRYQQLAKTFKPMIIDTTNLINQMREHKKNILLEGAQGTLLDIDHGTYPYVTSSSTAGGGACTGTGIGPKHINKIIGVVKAYTTRVGAGPFPTELFGDTGHHLAQKGQEKGATTGRDRRCGWLDLVLLEKAVQINSVTEICITKLDVLDGLSTIKICVAYELDGKTIITPPNDSQKLARCRPIYEEHPGWQSSTYGISDYNKLPTNAKNYLKRIQKLLQVPINIISTGPDRKHTIILRHPFN